MNKTYKLPKMLPVFGIMALTAFGVEAAPDIIIGNISGDAGALVDLPVTFINDSTVLNESFPFA